MENQNVAGQIITPLKQTDKRKCFNCFFLVPYNSETLQCPAILQIFVLSKTFISKRGKKVRHYKFGLKNTNDKSELCIMR